MTSICFTINFTVVRFELFLPQVVDICMQAFIKLSIIYELADLWSQQMHCFFTSIHASS